MRWRSLVLTALLIALASAAQAQTTRAELLEQQRAQKATQLRPYERGKLEKLLLYAEQRDLRGRISPRNGFFVRYGFHEKPIGSGVGFGGGYRHDLFERRARILTEAGITFRNYYLLRADFSTPYIAHDRVELGVEVTRRHNPQEDFYGLGADSVKEDRVNYLLDTNALIGRAIVKPRPWLSAGAHIGRLDPEIGRGTDTRFPTIQDHYEIGQVPGLAAQPSFGYGDLFATVDTRDQEGNPRAGGYYSLTFSRYDDRDFDLYDFRQVDLHLAHFFPIFDKKRVFAVRGRLLTSHLDDGSQMPFYYQPTIGGSTTVRGFSDYRFRDQNVFYLNAEYRWEAFSGLDMALFTDAGNVASKPGDLSFSDMKHAYGIGFRFNTYKAVLVRFDIGAGGSEGIQYYLKFSKAY